MWPGLRAGSWFCRSCRNPDRPSLQARDTGVARALLLYALRSWTSTPDLRCSRNRMKPRASRGVREPRPFGKGEQVKRTDDQPYRPARFVRPSRTPSPISASPPHTAPESWLGHQPQGSGQGFVTAVFLDWRGTVLVHGARDAFAPLVLGGCCRGLRNIGTGSCAKRLPWCFLV